MLPKLTEVVNKDTKARFQFYRSGELWYDITYKLIFEDEVVIGSKVFSFPVPVEDTGTAVFKREDKSVVFLKWVRRQLKTLEELDVDHGQNQEE